MLALLSTALAGALAEGFVRLADGGMAPQLDCYVRVGEAVALRPGCERRLRRPGGGTWSLTIDEEGRRVVPGALPPGRPWRLYGDSQVFAMGVDAEESGVAAARAAGLPVEGDGVPGRGVEESVAAAAHEGGDVAVVVNAANDWADWGHPEVERYAVRGGWLLSPSVGEGWVGEFFASRLSRSHLLVLVVWFGFRDWSPDVPALRLADSPWGLPEGERARVSRGMGEALAGLAARRRGRTAVVLLPADLETSSARAAEVLGPRAAEVGVVTHWAPLLEVLDAAGVEVCDLRAALPDPGDWLPGDYHLSVSGQRRFGEGVAGCLGAAPPPQEAP